MFLKKRNTQKKIYKLRTKKKKKKEKNKYFEKSWESLEESETEMQTIVNERTRDLLNDLKKWNEIWFPFAVLLRFAVNLDQGIKSFFLSNFTSKLPWFFLYFCFLSLSFSFSLSF